MLFLLVSVVLENVGSNALDRSRSIATIHFIVSRQGTFLSCTFSVFNAAKDDGGISDRPENLADVFHLFFGICGLSMMDAEKYGLKTISAEYALPKDRLKSIPLV